jgi:hypothetical protein
LIAYLDGMTTICVFDTICLRFRSSDWRLCTLQDGGIHDRAQGREVHSVKYSLIWSKRLVPLK